MRHDGTKAGGAVLLLGVLAAALLGCGPGEAATCDPPCTIGLRCVDGMCVRPGGPVPDGGGLVCPGDPACPQTPDGGCGGDDDCPEGSFCGRGLCYSTDPTAVCARSAACPSGNCVSGQ